MSDLIASSSLLMAVITMLFSLWYGEIVNLLNTTGETYAADNKGLVKKIKRTLFSKLLILIILSFAVSFIFLPDVIHICSETYNIIFSEVNFSGTYNAVKAAFVLVFIICAGLTIYMIILALKMICKWRQLSKN